MSTPTVATNSEVRISADSHMIEPVDLWQKRMPGKFRDRALAWAGPERRREGGWVPSARLKDMALDGVVAEVLYPTRAKSIFRQDYDPEISEASARVYNDWMIEFCSEAPDRLWGQAIIPLWNIEYAVEELERCRKAGLVGATTWMIPPDDIHFDSAGHYERFWSAAEDLEMPVSMHINNGFGAYLIGKKEDGKEFRVHRTDWSAMDSLKGRATEHKQVTADALTDIICSGVLERHPRLKIVVAEVEVGWIPFWLEEVDKRFKRRGKLPLLPSEYFYRQVYSTFTEDPVGGALLARWGADSFMWSNDYPHTGVGDIWLFSGAIIERDLGHLSPAIRAKALRETVAKLYGKTIPAQMPASTASDPTLDEWREERAGHYAGIS